MLLGACLFGWLVCAVFTYGVMLAKFQREFPNKTFQLPGEWKGIGFWLFVGLLGGPVALAIVFCLTGGARYGVVFWYQSQGRQPL